jgi:hypothetical protein
MIEVTAARLEALLALPRLQPVAIVLPGPTLADGIPYLFAAVPESPVSGVSGGEATAPGTVLGGDS